MRDVGHEPVLGIGRGHKRLNAGEHGGDVERRLPRALRRHVETVQADAPVRVDVGVVDAGDEAHARRLERVLARNVQLQPKHAAVVRRVGRAGDLGVQHVQPRAVVARPRRNAGRGAAARQQLQLARDALVGHRVHADVARGGGGGGGDRARSRVTPAPLAPNRRARFSRRIARPGTRAARARHRRQPQLRRARARVARARARRAGAARAALSAAAT
ncbi:hypothetical protein FGB62_228g03 [Gracilaria domingensis]|nr:hypothetical protein FGB62_228g03 [Gracilaria domingensis]